MIRVVLADDDALVRGGLRALLGAEEDIDVVGEAADGRQAVSRARELHPDVVLMDVRMPSVDGVSATREIVSWPRRPRVLVLTTFDLDEVVDDALGAGADGFLLKRASPEQLVDGIRTVFAGDALVAPAVTRRLLAAHAGRRPSDRERLAQAAQLTEREAEVLRALAEGLSNAEIATRIWISPETVKTHIKSVLAKLEVRGPALVSAVRTVAAGGTVFDGEAAAVPDRRGTRRQADRLERLTPRERTVLRLIGEGLSNRQIGERMGLTEKTVKNYTSHLLAKLGLQRRTQAAILATRLRDHRLRREPA